MSLRNFGGYALLLAASVLFGAIGGAAGLSFPVSCGLWAVLWFAVTGCNSLFRKDSSE